MAKSHEKIVLIGHMGAGKSSVGQRLAYLMHLPFVDTDHYIERQCRRSIPEIFAKEGEDYFRRVEYEVIKTLIDGPPAIIATGGGAFIQEKTRALIKRKAISIWLHCPTEELHRRTSQCTHRPLIAHSEDPHRTLDILAQKRNPFYKQADITIDAHTCHEDVTAQSIFEVLMENDRTTTLPISLKDGTSYDITIGSDLLDKVGTYLKKFTTQNKCIIITDSNVAPLYLDTLKTSLGEEGYKAIVIEIDPGEKSKSLHHFGKISYEILEKGINRQTFLIALGGGVVGDLAGFIASTLLRGIPFLQVPTTLLAQVDSSVGGKTGVNTPFGKNLIGSFYQPTSVISDVSTLKTLPLRQIQSGYAEIVKCALIGDRHFFAWCEYNVYDVFHKKPKSLIYAVEKACQFKAKIVSQDEKEQHNKAGRILLNLGHTFAHALETEMGYDGTLLHGEAVLIGLNLSFALAVQLGLCPSEDYQRVIRHLEHLDMRVHVRDLPKPLKTHDLMEHMRKDKKNNSANPTFVLPKSIGKAIVVRDVPTQDVETILRKDGAL